MPFFMILLSGFFVTRLLLMVLFKLLGLRNKNTVDRYFKTYFANLGASLSYFYVLRQLVISHSVVIKHMNGHILFKNFPDALEAVKEFFYRKIVANSILAYTPFTFNNIVIIMGLPQYVTFNNIVTIMGLPQYGKGKLKVLNYSKLFIDYPNPDIFSSNWTYLNLCGMIPNMPILPPIFYKLFWMFAHKYIDFILQVIVFKYLILNNRKNGKYNGFNFNTSYFFRYNLMHTLIINVVVPPIASFITDLDMSIGAGNYFFKTFAVLMIDCTSVMLFAFIFYCILAAATNHYVNIPFVTNAAKVQIGPKT
jgi:hypothetical protein